MLLLVFSSFPLGILRALFVAVPLGHPPLTGEVSVVAFIFSSASETGRWMGEAVFYVLPKNGPSSFAAASFFFVLLPCVLDDTIASEPQT